MPGDKTDEPLNKKPWENYHLEAVIPPGLDDDVHYDRVMENTITHQRLMEVTGKSSGELEEWVRGDWLIRIGRGYLGRYPVWQFIMDDSDPPQLVPRACIPALMQRFFSKLGVPSWHLRMAQWAASPHPALDGRSPASWLVDGMGDDELLRRIGP